MNDDYLYFLTVLRFLYPPSVLDLLGEGPPVKDEDDDDDDEDDDEDDEDDDEDDKDEFPLLTNPLSPVASCSGVNGFSSGGLGVLK